jgi:hypothetical protein
MDKIEGFLEVGHTEDTFDVVVNHPDLKPDENGVGHIVFSPAQARNLARLLLQQADEAQHAWFQAQQQKKFKAAEAIPVDYSQRTISGHEGAPVTEDHKEINSATGQQNGYVVLTAAERAKGFVRPVRRTYIHAGKPPDGQSFEYPIRKVFAGGCGTRTTCSQDIAETYARDPGFYSGTFCCSCRAHFPLEQFVWEGTTEQVGT